MRRRNAFRSCVQACEILELRTVPSSASFVDGVLTLMGSNGNNTITVTENESQVLVKIDRAAQQAFQKNLIGEVRIFGLNGNDRITVNHSLSALYFHIEGGKGNDTVIVDLNEGGGAIFGGSGNDKLSAGITGINTSCNLYGEQGNDTLSGGNGRDALYGDQGNDSLLGGNGDDELYGGSGNDRMFGGNGTDFLLDIAGRNFLDGGNDGDRLSVGSRRNTILGGAGGDEITIDHLSPQGLIDGGVDGASVYGPNILFGGFSGSDQVDIRIFDDVRMINVGNFIHRH